MQRNNTYTFLGAIAGDAIGSVFEFDNNKSIDFPLFNQHTEFTDDMVIATAKIIREKDMEAG